MGGQSQPTVRSAIHSMTWVGKHTFCRTHSASVLTVRRPLRNFPVSPTVLLQTAHYRCRKSAVSREVQAAAARQDVQSPTPQSARTLTRTKPEFVLPGSQLANKQVVTRTMGRILGVVDYLLADPNTCRVVALTFKDADDILPGDPPKQIGLMSLKQISDVLLVHDDRALLQQQLTVGLGYVKIVGTVVKSGDGKVLGKVRDFDFSPDDGRITNLVIDALGIPALPVRLLGCSAVRIQMVQNITWNCITLSPGAEAYIQKLSTGLFDSAVNLLKTAQQYSAFAQPETSESRDDPPYVEWYLDHGRDYEQMDPSGKLAVPSDIALQSALQARRAKQPQALPPGRQPSYASQLQQQLQSPQLQPEPVQWFDPQQGQTQQQTQPQSQLFEQQMPPQSAGWAQQQQQQQQDPQLWLQQQSRQQAQQPRRPQLEQQTPPLNSQYLSQAQQQGQLQQQLPGQLPQAQNGQEAWYGNQQSPATDFYASSPSRLEQQRRFASRTKATITEPRFDPRRRKTGTQIPPGPAASSSAPPNPSGSPESVSRYASQSGSNTQGSPTTSYRPGRPESSVDGARYGAQPSSGSPGAPRQPGTQQQSPQRAAAERQQAAAEGQQLQAKAQTGQSPVRRDQGFDSSSQQRDTGRSSGSGAEGAAGQQQGYLSSKSEPPAQDFDSWAQVSNGSLNGAVAVMPDGSLDAV